MLLIAKHSCLMIVFGLRIFYDLALFAVLAGCIGRRRTCSVSHVAENAAWRTAVFDIDVSDAVATANHQPQSDRALVVDATSRGGSRIAGVCIYETSLASDGDRTRRSDKRTIAGDPGRYQCQHATRGCLDQSDPASGRTRSEVATTDKSRALSIRSDVCSCC